MGGTLTHSQTAKRPLFRGSPRTPDKAALFYWSLPLLYAVPFSLWLLELPLKCSPSTLIVELTLLALLAFVAAAGPHLSLTRVLADFQYSALHKTPYRCSTWHVYLLVFFACFCLAVAWGVANAKLFILPLSLRLLFLSSIFLFVTLLPCSETFTGKFKRIIAYPCLATLFGLTLFIKPTVIVWPFLFAGIATVGLVASSPKTMPCSLKEKKHELALVLIGPILILGLILSLPTNSDIPRHTREIVHLASTSLLIFLSLMFFLFSNKKSETKLAPIYEHIHSILGGNNKTQTSIGDPERHLNRHVVRECLRKLASMTAASTVLCILLPFISFGLLDLNGPIVLMSLKSSLLFSICFVVIQFFRMNALGWCLAYASALLLTQLTLHALPLPLESSTVLKLLGLLLLYLLGLWALSFRAKHFFFYVMD